MAVTNNNNKRVMPLCLAGLLGLAVLAGLETAAHAAVGGAAPTSTAADSFKKVNTAVRDIIGGTGGALIAALAVVFAGAASVMRFNPGQVMGAAGVGALIGAGPSVLDTIRTAVI